jgi:hypothetical protein
LLTRDRCKRRAIVAWNDAGLRLQSARCSSHDANLLDHKLRGFHTTGLNQACEALKQADLPPYADPPVTPLPWATAYPI